MPHQKDIWDEKYKGKGNWNRETLDLPKVLKGKSVLEIGVGNGKTLKSIIRMSPESVIAIDISSEAVKIARKLFPNGVEIMESDVLDMPFKENEFDIIVCYYILNNLLEKERKKAMNELFRVTKKGGKVLFEDLAVGDFRQERKMERVEKNTIKKGDGLICHYFTINELNKLFKKFSGKRLKLTESSLIKNLPHLKRRVISGVIVK